MRPEKNSGYEARECSFLITAVFHCFTGRLEPVGDWPEKLIAAYAADFGEDQ